MNSSIHFIDDRNGVGNNVSDVSGRQVSQTRFFALLAAEQCSSMQSRIQRNFEPLFQPFQFSLGKPQTRTWHQHEGKRKGIPILTIVAERDKRCGLVSTDVNCFR
ncbi:hypothetical protein P0D75_34485 [Paraburkholderia sediminicola]|uniref:hypothetical protein n=1 Tax=Paraburkholderia sediminicola TaxID=458836 RepID=UPI000F175F25